MKLGSYPAVVPEDLRNAASQERCDSRAGGRRARAASRWSARSAAHAPPDRQAMGNAQSVSETNASRGHRRRCADRDRIAPPARGAPMGPVDDPAMLCTGFFGRQEESGRGQPREFTDRRSHLSFWRTLSAPPAIAARRIRTCNQGIQGPSRFHEAWTISSSSGRIPPGLDNRDRLTNRA